MASASFTALLDVLKSTASKEEVPGTRGNDDAGSVVVVVVVGEREGARAAVPAADGPRMEAGSLWADVRDDGRVWEEATRGDDSRGAVGWP